MRSTILTLFAFAASLTPVDAQSLFGQRHLWGRGGMGKLTPVKRQAVTSSTPVADSTCKHGPRNRACWRDGYSVATDFDLKHPNTGVTRKYNLELTNTTCNPDGFAEQQCLLVNNQYPGPTIFADWGDDLEVTVVNKMQDNGTGIHWHGVRQLNSVGHDGVDGITACPIAPGDSYTYKFKVTQFGTSWYHSHFSSQYGAGIVGQLVFNGPSTANYDVDLGTFTVSDWYYAGAFRVNDLFLQGLQAGGPGPNADAILINGTAKSAKGGAWAKVEIESGKTYKLRLINPSTDNFIKVKLDGHAFSTISADFIPTVPTPVNGWVNFGPGQRHDVVFKANATAGNYWFRAEVAGDCLSGNNGHGRALFTYKGQSVVEPADSNEAPPLNGCAETPTAPFWRQPVEQSTFDTQVKQLTTALTQAQFTTNGQNLVLWALNFTSMNVDWNYPTMKYLFDRNTNYPKNLDIIEIPDLGIWTYWIIQTLQTTLGPNAIAAPPPPHPIHLHGHDFFVLGRGTGEQFNRSTASLNFDTPARRDTTVLPSRGWVAIAFPTNNPGAWLMHCHINWHVSEGFGVQFLEAKDQIVLPDKTEFDQTCAKWKAFSATMPWPKSDSGL